MNDSSSANTMLLEVKRRLWDAFNILKQNCDLSDYHVILYLLVLNKEGFLNGFLSERPEDTKKRLISRLHSFKSDNKNLLLEIHQIFENSINRTSNRVVFHVIKEISMLNKHVLEENFPEIFDDLLYKIFRSGSRLYEQNHQPLEITRLMTALADVKEESKVYNPFAGFASIPIALNNRCKYYGQEKQHDIWAIGALRIIAYGRLDNVWFNREDTLETWNPQGILKFSIQGGSQIVNPVREKFDLIISTPPFGLRILNQFSQRFGATTSVESFLIGNGIDDLSDDGKLIILIPNSFLFKNVGAEGKLRQYLVDADLVDLVVSFPPGLLPGTIIPINLLVLSKKKKYPGQVLFIKGDRFSKEISRREKKLDDINLHNLIKSGEITSDCRLVSNEIIVGHKYNLNVPIYFQREFEGVPLGEVAQAFLGLRNFREDFGRIVRIKDLMNDRENFLLDSPNLEESEIPPRFYKIQESCLLISSKGNYLKPTWFNFSGEPIYISPDIISVSVKNSLVNNHYLVYELYSEDFNEQVRPLRGGSVISTLRREDLLKVKVKIPSLAVQDSVLKGIKDVRSLDIKREQELKDKIRVLEEELFEQTAFLRHSLAGTSSNLKAMFYKLKQIVLEKLVINNPEVLNLKLAEDQKFTLGNYLDKMERDILKIKDTVAKQLKANDDIDSKEIFPVEITAYLNNLVDEINERKLNFSAKFSFDPETFLNQDGQVIKTYIFGNKDLFTDLFDNLLNNAEAHAFCGEEGHRIEIDLIKNVDSEDQEIQILFSNTGKPFPEDFSIDQFIRKGSKAGQNAGNGFGGWYINEIIKKLGGRLEIIDETGDEGFPNSDLATTIVLNFPILDAEEHEEI